MTGMKAPRRPSASDCPIGRFFEERTFAADDVNDRVWPSLAVGCRLTVALYLAMVWTLAQFGVKL
jgi:hypothetical protein